MKRKKESLLTHFSNFFVSNQKRKKNTESEYLDVIKFWVLQQIDIFDKINHDQKHK